MWPLKRWLFHTFPMISERTEVCTRSSKSGSSSSRSRWSSEIALKHVEMGYKVIQVHGDCCTLLCVLCLHRIPNVHSSNTTASGKAPAWSPGQLPEGCTPSSERTEIYKYVQVLVEMSEPKKFHKLSSCFMLFYAVSAELLHLHAKLMSSGTPAQFVPEGEDLPVPDRCSLLIWCTADPKAPQARCPQGRCCRPA